MTDSELVKTHHSFCPLTLNGINMPVDLVELGAGQSQLLLAFYAKYCEQNIEFGGNEIFCKNPDRVNCGAVFASYRAIVPAQER